MKIKHYGKDKKDFNFYRKFKNAAVVTSVSSNAYRRMEEKRIAADAEECRKR